MLQGTSCEYCSLRKRIIHQDLNWSESHHHIPFPFPGWSLIIDSIVGVHGLNSFSNGSNAISTWTADNGRMWLADPDFLLSKILNARRMVFSYNSNSAFSPGTAGVDEQARSLLFRLKMRRQACPMRPIIFICHSLGGLLVKRV